MAVSYLCELTELYRPKKGPVNVTVTRSYAQEAPILTPRLTQSSSQSTLGRANGRRGYCERMKLRVMPYVTVEIDDRLRRRLRRAGERLRLNVRAHLLSAADDVDTASDKVRGMCDRAVNRVDSVVATVNDRIAPTEAVPAAPAPGLQSRSQLGRADAAGPSADEERAGDHHEPDDRHRNRPRAPARHRRLRTGRRSRCAESSR